MHRLFYSQERCHKSELRHKSKQASKLVSFSHVVILLFWSRIRYTAATTVLGSFRQRKGRRMAAKDLCRKAKDMGSKDDITAIVVRFEVK